MKCYNEKCEWLGSQNECDWGNRPECAERVSCAPESAGYVQKMRLHGHPKMEQRLGVPNGHIIN